MLNRDVPPQALKALRLVVFDSDGVAVPRGTEISEKIEDGAVEKDVLRIKTFIITDEFAELIDRLRGHLKVAVSSGRSLLYLQMMFAPIVGDNTILSAENGNLSLIDGQIVQHFDYAEEYFELLTRIREDVRDLPIKGVEPKQFILSIHADREIKEVYDIVAKHDTGKTLRVMWNGEAFDIQRRDVSKAAGLKRLLDHLGLDKGEVIAIGDRVNDREMIELAGIGVSADHENLPAEYWTTGGGLPGQQLAEYLVKTLGL
jgi:HAD superfamily hydrolase (TIGR01484 family)